MEPIDQQPDPSGIDPPASLDPAARPETTDAAIAESSPSPSAPPAPPSAVSAPSKRRGYWKWFGAAALLAVAVATGAFIANSNSTDTVPIAASTTGPTSTIVPAIATPSTAEEPAEITAVLLDASNVGDVVIPSVVAVQIYASPRNLDSATPSDSATDERPIGSGSGVVYDDQGHIVTNNHVVAAGASYKIVLADGRVYPAELVGTDPTTDLAVLSISAEGLDAIALGSSDELTVGDPAVAIGSPLGLDGGPSLTVGVISAFGREVQTDPSTALFGMLQTDAPITQGSSGGALVDANGRLIGITTAVGVSEVGIEGIGFATPVEVVTRVVDEIIANGTASAAYLGIYGGTSFLDTTDGGSKPIGVAIESIEPNTAASLAGLNPGDVITAVNDDTVKTMLELVATLRRYGAGTTVQLSLEDGSMVEVVLGQRPNA